MEMNTVVNDEEENKKKAQNFRLKWVFMSFFLQWYPNIRLFGHKSQC